MSARQPLLALLRAHAALPLDPCEAAMAAAIIAFVEAEPRCAERSLAGGHLTGSAWIVDTARRRALLTHHRKLGLWLQPGGHADGEPDLRAVAWREAREESGLGDGAEAGASNKCQVSSIKKSAAREARGAGGEAGRLPLATCHLPLAGVIDASTGAGGLRPLDTAIFDVDIHRIPARPGEPKHWHYDVRFLFEAGADEPLVVNGESRELAWVPLGEIAARNPSESLARMVRKTQARFGARPPAP